GRRRRDGPAQPAKPPPVPDDPRRERPCRRRGQRGHEEALAGVCARRGGRLRDRAAPRGPGARERPERHAAKPSLSPPPSTSPAAGVAISTARAETRAAPEVSTSRLPVTGSDLFGREDDLAWLDRCWEEGAHVASIVAWGGVGKSALVNAWLARAAGEGWRGAERVYG